MVDQRKYQWLNLFEWVPYVYFMGLAILFLCYRKRQYFIALVTILLFYFVLIPSLKQLCDRCGFQSYRPKNGTEPAFPSGHAFVVWFMVSWTMHYGYGPKWLWVVLCLVAISTMYQRSYFGWHDRIQLVGGMVLGLDLV